MQQSGMGVDLEAPQQVCMLQAFHKGLASDHVPALTMQLQRRGYCCCSIVAVMPSKQTHVHHAPWGTRSESVEASQQRKVRAACPCELK